MKVIYLREWQVQQIFTMLRARCDRLAMVKLIVGFAARIGRLEYNAARIQSLEDEEPHYDLMIYCRRHPEEYVLVATTPFRADWPEIRELYEFFAELYYRQNPDDFDLTLALSGKSIRRPRYPGAPMVAGGKEITNNLKGRR